MYNNLTTFASITPYLTPPPENNFAAESDKNWKAAREYRNSLDNESPTEKAHCYFARYPNYPIDKFYSTTRQRKAKAKHALKSSGWAQRLFDQLGYPNTNTPAFFYSLSVSNLGLPIDYSNPQFIYYPLVIAEIKTAIAKHIPKPLYWRIEVGRDGAVHVHLIGPHAPLLSHLAGEGSKRVQAIRPGTELTLLAYLSKPTAPWSAANYGIYLEAKANKQTKYLPQLSGQLGIKKSPQRGRL
jgi:hypothetical protein